MRSPHRWPGTARHRGVLVRSVGLLMLAMIVAVPAVARADSPTQGLPAAARATSSAVAATPAAAVELSTAPAPSPAGATTDPDPALQASASASHIGEVPAPRFEAISDGSRWQAVLVVAVPAVPAIVMAFIVFGPRTRQPRRQQRTRQGQPAPGTRDPRRSTAPGART